MVYKKESFLKLFKLKKNYTGRNGCKVAPFKEKDEKKLMNIFPYKKLRWMCSECKVMYATVGELVKHQELSHDCKYAKKQRPCPLCTKTFTQRARARPWLVHLSKSHSSDLWNIYKNSS